MNTRPKVEEREGVAASHALSPLPKANEAQVRAHAEMILGSGDGCLELRVIGNKGSADFKFRQNEVGFYSDLDAFVRDALLNHNKRSVFVGQNLRKVELLHAQPANQLRAGEGGKNEDVIRRSRFGIDIDTVRAVSRIAASDVEIEQALSTFESVRVDLEIRGVIPIPGMSGNGRHLNLITIDYPISPELDGRDGAFALLLRWLQRKWGGPHAEIDVGVYDPARVWKLYGTAAIKGGNTIERPWRTSSFDVPDALPAPVDIISLYADEINEQRAFEKSLIANSHARPTSSIDLVKLFKERPRS